MVRLQTQILWLVLFSVCPNSMVSGQTESVSKTQVDRSAFDRALATVRKSYPNGDLPIYLYDETSGALISVVWPKNRFFFIVSPNEFKRECSLIPLTKSSLSKSGWMSKYWRAPRKCWSDCRVGLVPRPQSLCAQAPGLRKHNSNSSLR